MPNVSISDLPDAILPFDPPNTFFEVETREGGVPVSRRVAGDAIVFNIFPPPTVEGSVVRGDLAGATFAESVLLNIGDGTTNTVQLDGVANGGPDNATFIINAPLGQDAAIQMREDGAGTFRLFYDSSDTAAKVRLVDPGVIQFEEGNGVVILAELDSVAGQARLWAGTAGVDVPVARTVLPAAGGLEVDNQVTGAGFERVLTTSDIGAALPAGSVNDSLRLDVGPDTYVATSLLQLSDTSVNQVTINGVANGGAGVTSLRLNASIGQDAEILLQENGANRVQVAYDDSLTRLIFRMFATGQPIQFDDSTNVALLLTPNGQQVMRNANVEVMRTLTAAAGGLEVNNQSTGAGFERVLTTSDLGGGGNIANGTVTNSLVTWDNGGGQWTEFAEFQALVDGGDNVLRSIGAGVDIAIQAEDGGGVPQTVFFGNGGGVAGMNFDGDVAFRVFNFGADLFDAKAVGTTRLVLRNSGGTQLAVFEATATDAEIRTPSSTATFEVRTGGFISEAMMILTGGGACRFFNANVEVMTTDANGLNIGTNIVGANVTCDVQAPSNQDGIYRAWNNVGGLRLEVLNTTGLVRLGQADNTGVFQESWFEMARNGAVTGFFDGAAAFRSRNLGATGGAALEAWDGVGFFPVWAHRTARKTSPTTRTNATSFSADPDLQLNSLPAGNYKVEVFLLVQSTGAASNVQVGLAWSGAVNDSRGVVWTGPPSGGGATFTAGLVQGTTLTSAPTALTFGSPTSTTFSHLIHCECFFDANGVGNLQVFWTSASANNVSVVAQSRLVATLMEL